MIKQIADKTYMLSYADTTLDLFEGQYKIPNGVTYNSYVIMDEKIAVLDTMDQRASEEYFNMLDEVLKGKEPDYLIISHLEPDHSANIKALLDKYKNMKIVGNNKTYIMLPNFIRENLEDRKMLVDEKAELCLGAHTLKFVMAPMIHWPEVMVEYDTTTNVLFSADAFGKFGVDFTEDWTDEARRYFINIVGKYGNMVQALLKKIPSDVKVIAPLHGPVLNDNLSTYVDKYKTWSSYEKEEDGVTIACASIHGNTLKYAKLVKEELEENNIKVELFDLSRDMLSEAVASAFKFSHLVLAASTYDASVFSPMKDYMHRLQAKNFQNRKIAFIENGSWAPMSAKQMKEVMAQLPKVEILEKAVTIKSTISNENIQAIKELIEWAKN